MQLSVLLFGLSCCLTPAAESAGNTQVIQGKYVNKYNQVVPGHYLIGKNGEYYQVTNTDILWPGTWKQSADGWRVQLGYFTNDGNKECITIGVGNVLTNPWGHFVSTPNNKFERFELKDANGIIISPRSGMLQVDHFPDEIRIRTLPAWPDGKLKNRIACFTNSPPHMLKSLSIHDVYQITNEGDYTFTVCVAIYKLGTNGFANKVNLPCVTTKLHLKR